MAFKEQNAEHYKHPILDCTVSYDSESKKFTKCIVCKKDELDFKINEFLSGQHDVDNWDFNLVHIELIRGWEKDEVIALLCMISRLKQETIGQAA